MKFIADAIWKPTYVYPDRYEVNQFGQVRVTKTKKILSCEETHKGYLRVNLTKNGKKKHVRVHRLVAMAFIENPFGKPQVNHIDGNKHNNRVGNLEWCTNTENRTHAIAHGLIRKRSA